MVFYRGRPSKCSFSLDNQPLEVVNEFVYLGFTFTTQLSFTKHVEKIIAKANSRCGVLASKLPLKDLPIDLVLRIFNCYVVPLYRCGLQLWLGSCSSSALESINSSFTKFLKRYLGVPYYCNNAITHFITQTIPLTTQLHGLLDAGLGAFTLPASFSGYQISFLSDHRPAEPFNSCELIPSHFWRSQVFQKLPDRFRNRKMLMRDIFDLDHEIYCSRKEFHLINVHDCQCKVCGHVLDDSLP